jgi:hypothetical protein
MTIAKITKEPGSEQAIIESSGLSPNTTTLRVHWYFRSADFPHRTKGNAVYSDPMPEEIDFLRANPALGSVIETINDER